MAKQLRMAPKCPCSFPQLGLTGVPLPLLSRLALAKIAELERPRRQPKALGTTSNLLSGSPSSIPCSRSDTCRANELPSTVGLPSSRAIREEPMPRYKCKSIAALDIALGGLPAKMQVEADVGTGVSAKTVRQPCRTATRLA